MSRAATWRVTGALALLLLVVAGFSRLRFQADVLDLLPADIPTVAGLKLHQRHFAGAQELVVTLRAESADSALDSATTLAAKLRDNPQVGAVVATPPWRDGAAISELVALAWLNRPPADFAAMLDQLSPVAASNTLLRVRERLATSFSAGELARLSYDPLELTRVLGGGDGAPDADTLFASADGTFRVVFVRPKGKLSGYTGVRRWLDGVRGTITEFENSTGWTGAVRLTGGPAFQSEISRSMERDLHNSALGTLLVVGALIWLLHRRIAPVLRILGLLVATLALSLAAAGLLLGELNLISVGFAAILLGLAADYGLVLYHESFDAAGDRAAVRRRVGPGIIWSALTTACAFALLALAGLPGLAQLGVLVAAGILIAAAVMLRGFPMAGRERSAAIAANAAADGFASAPDAAHQQSADRSRSLTLASALGAAVLLAWVLDSPPRLDWTSAPLRPVGIESYAALEEMQRELAQSADPLWLVVPGADESEVHGRLSRLEAALRAANERDGADIEWQLPGALWPDPAAQAQNLRATAGRLDTFGQTLDAARALGFEDAALALARGVVEQWRAVASRPQGAHWPESEAARWMTDQFAARFPGGAVALGFVRPPPEFSAEQLDPLRAAVAESGALLTGWTLLGPDLMGAVLGRLATVLAVVAVVLLAALWLAFRTGREVLLSMAAVALGLLMLLAVMGAAGWEWNLMNLLALPLMLGTGIDYGIHMQLALRRSPDRRAAMRGVGRALLLCAATTVVGFGSLGFSSNAGLASLGRVCAAGVACMAVAAIGLLPAWWGALVGAGAGETARTRGAPPRIYRAFFWRCGLAVARVLPRRMLRDLCGLGARAFRLCNPGRVATAVSNLLPVFDGDRAAAGDAARRLFDEFGLKLADLWRAEAGHDIAPLVRAVGGWEALDAAQAGGRGLLLVTPHLGNWEFGAPLILRRGLTLNVLTLAEPGADFTALRDAARRRAGVRTHVVGGDPFAFVEIIKRLQAGEAVALLMDRPPSASAVRVELFGKPFDASIAVAELARASGAAILPVTVCRDGDAYAVRVLGEVKYDRAALGGRAARIALTGEILRAFEPSIRQHPAQWFHFVPLWPR